LVCCTKKNLATLVGIFCLISEAPSDSQILFDNAHACIYVCRYVCTCSPTFMTMLRKKHSLTILIIIYIRSCSWLSVWTRLKVWFQYYIPTCNIKLWEKICSAESSLITSNSSNTIHFTYI
jgi:hypothetical protein